MSFQVLCPFLNPGVWVFLLSVRNSFYILCISLLYQICKFQIFSLILWVSFYFSTLLKIIWPYVWGFNSGLCILFSWYICLSLYQSHTVLITVILQQVRKSGSVNPPGLFYLFKIVLAIWGPLRFHMNFRVGFSTAAKNITEIFFFNL